MFGCSSWAVISASCTKSRWARGRCRASSAASVFTATRRRRLGSYIRRTVAVPPAPISPSSSSDTAALRCLRRAGCRETQAARSARRSARCSSWRGRRSRRAARCRSRAPIRKLRPFLRPVRLDGDRPRRAAAPASPTAPRAAAPPGRASAPAPTPASRAPASGPSGRAEAGPAPASARASAPRASLGRRRRDRQDVAAGLARLHRVDLGDAQHRRQPLLGPARADR